MVEKALSFWENDPVAMKNQKRLILALDGPGPEESVSLLKKLRNVIGICKVGPALFAAGGETLLRRIGDLGFELFLDLKFHDIPETVHRAILEAARPPVRFLTVHALGGAKMLDRAVDAAREAAANRSGERVRILAVTILTSLSSDDLERVGISKGVDTAVTALAKLACDRGVDGSVCSGREAALVRSACGADFLILTPGIRPAKSPTDDQVRTVTPAEAIQQGADFLIVGRPILAAGDPCRAAREIISAIEAAVPPG